MFSTTELAKNRDDDQEQQQRHQEEEEEFLRKLEVIANSVHNCIGRLAAFEAKLSKAFASARSLTRKFVRSMAFNSSGFSYWFLLNALFWHLAKLFQLSKGFLMMKIVLFVQYGFRNVLFCLF